MNVAEFSIKRPVTTIMFFLSMIVIGLIAALRLPLEALPDVSAPFLFILLPYSGSTPEEVERNLVRPVEETLATLPGIKRLHSISSADRGRILIEFSDWDRDIAIAASEARERIDAIRSDLPEDFRRYYVYKWSSSDEPILRVRLFGATDITAEYDTIDREFKRPVERIAGVASVDISGAPANEVEVAIDSDRLRAHDLSLNELTVRLQSVNFSVSAGEIEDRGQRLRVQPVGELHDLQQLRDLVINAQGLRLSDIADVRLRAARLNYERRVDGKPAVVLEVYKERSANLVEVSSAALHAIEAIGAESSLTGLQIQVIDNQGQNVRASLSELAEAGWVGLLLSVLVLYFFLRHWPSTLMVSLAIPICFIMTLGFMYFIGVTLNILTMMGLLLAVGMLVDNAVVVVESIYQEREKYPGQVLRASVVGTRHVAIALSAGTLCHCIVFVPNIFGETNQVSIFMFQIAITISFSLLASWLVAVSLIPMLSSKLPTPVTLQSGHGVISRLQTRYARFLRWTLQHRGWSVLGIIAITAISLLPASALKMDMFGSEGGRETYITYQWKASFTREQIAQEVDAVEAFLLNHRERFQIAQVYSRFSEQGDTVTIVTFDLQEKKLATLTEALREALPLSARVDYVLGGWSGGGSASQQGRNSQVRLTGDSTAMLFDIAQDVIPVMAQRPQLRDVHIDEMERGTELAIRVDRARAAAFGFNVDEVARFIGIALRGAQLRDFQRGDVEVPVWVRFSGAEDYRIDDLAGFTLRARDGREVPLLSLIDVADQPASASIHRNDRQTSLTVKAALAEGVTTPQARQAMDEALQSIAFPAGYGYTFEGGDFQDDQEALQQMLFNLVIAFLLIYMVMAAVFESLLFPAAIMSGVVFSIFGVVWLFWLTDTAFSVMAFIGVLVLMGVVVNNGIVMIEHINNHRRRGMSRIEALIAGSRERLRPILMTMGTAILAMIPISLTRTQLFGNGPPYYPMARAIAGGLAFSTVVSLLFLPTIYAILDDTRIALRSIVRRIRKKASTRQSDSDTAM